MTSITIPLIFHRIDLVRRIHEISCLEEGIASDPTFAKNTKRKNYLLAAYKGISHHVALHDNNVVSYRWSDWSRLFTTRTYISSLLDNFFRS